MANAAMKKFFDMCAAQGLMLTYGDVRLRTRYSEVKPEDPRMTTRTLFSRNIPLNKPIVSSPMDTVTAAPMAIAMAEAGGIGIIHRGLSPEAQAKEVGRVKRRMHGLIKTPLTAGLNRSVSDVLHDLKEHDFRTVPVLDKDDTVVGLVTGRDFDFCKDHTLPVRDIMVPLANVVKAKPDCAVKEAYELLMAAKKDVLPLVADDGTLAGMYLISDLKRIVFRTGEHNLDQNGQLRVGAAVGVGLEARKRAELLARKGCDVFVIDTAHGNSQDVVLTINELKAAYPSIDVVAGNVSSSDGALTLMESGADGILVGQGPGSICTTRIVAGVGVPQVSAVWECVQAVKGEIPVCADGGVGSSGDMVIAFAVGASSVMLGRLLAGTEEAPGDVRTVGGKKMKVYRGMGSAEAMRDNISSRRRYGQGDAPLGKLVPEGVEAVIPFEGSVAEVIDLFVGGIKAGMGYQGVSSIPLLHEKADIFRMTEAGLAESRPHDIIVTSEGRS